jgi:hypothetical protein
MLLALEIGQLEVFEHDRDQFVQIDLGFVVVDAGFFATLARLPLSWFRLLADNVTSFGVLPCAFAYLAFILTVDESVFLYTANGNFDDAITGAADDRLFRNDVCDVLADRRANLLAMANPVSGGSVGRRLPLRSKHPAHDAVSILP